MKAQALPSIQIDNEELIFTPLGSGNEVGRSSHLLEFKGKKILLDCGLHPGKRGACATPFFDAIEPSEVDIVLITHFHVDHVAALPYFTEKTSFKGEIFMTRPTRVVSELLLNDYVRIIQNNAKIKSEVLYDANDIKSCLRKCQVVDFHQVITAKGIKFTPLFAGHVLGAAMFLIEISNVRVLYTGDFSCELDRHLIPAEVPSSIDFSKTSKPLDLLIMESTFGTMVHQNREMREKLFTGYITSILNRSGVCLIPVFSLGRAQELLLILEAYWKAHPELQKFSIYHYSHVASKALEVYKTYTNVMNDSIREARKVKNPWEFDFIFPFQQTEEAVSKLVSEPCVIMASPGMLQNGVSRRVFEKICTNERNGIVLCGYSVEGTLAFTLARDSSVKSFQSAFSNVKLDVKCSIEQVSFAAHSDILGTREFVNKIKPKNLILVHGDSMQMKRLRQDLGSFFSEQHKNQLYELNEKLKQVKIRQEEDEDNKLEDTLALVLREEEKMLVTQIKNKEGEKIRIYMPHNTQRMILQFEDRRIIKLLGDLSNKKKVFLDKTLNSSEEILRNVDLLKLNGYLVRKNFDEILVSKDEIELFTELTRNIVTQQLLVSFHGTYEFLRTIISRLFDVVEIKPPGIGTKEKVLEVVELVRVHFEPEKGAVLLKWEVTLEAETVADAIVALLLQSESSVDAIKRSKCFCKSHSSTLLLENITDKVATPDKLQMEVESDKKISLEERLTNPSVASLYSSLASWFGKNSIKFIANIDTNEWKLRVTSPFLDQTDTLEVKENGQLSKAMETEVEAEEAFCDLIFDIDCNLVNVKRNKIDSSLSLFQKVLDLLESACLTNCKVEMLSQVKR